MYVFNFIILLIFYIIKKIGKKIIIIIKIK